MKKEPLSTSPYKGVRDFYPEDMAIQRYIFDTWSATAERFGFERYDASILEPAELYKSKGAMNQELVNDQTYTFTDRGDREVTLRPEMTPTVARMVAGRNRELTLPLRWYAIPNLFRYERTQRGRLREHWQLNCDIFGGNEKMADCEVILLAHSVLTSFGAKPEMFTIRVNSRKLLQEHIEEKLRTPELFPDYLRLLDRRAKISTGEFEAEENKLLKNGATVNIEINETLNELLLTLATLGVENVVFDPSITRGFDYYTDVVFEVFDNAEDNNRALLGGGRYENLTALFGGENISGVGFGMGDVTMRNFLETHNLLDSRVRPPAPTLMIIPTDESYVAEAEKVAHTFRSAGIATAVDISGRKVAKAISNADERGVQYILVLGEDEVATRVYMIKRLSDATETSGSIEELTAHIH